MGGKKISYCIVFQTDPDPVPDTHLKPSLSSNRSGPVSHTRLLNGISFKWIFFFYINTVQYEHCDRAGTLFWAIFSLYSHRKLGLFFQKEGKKYIDGNKATLS